MINALGRNVGKFRISMELLEDNYTDLLHTIFSNIIITRAECLYDWNAIEYIGHSKVWFQEVKEYCEIPEYTFNIKNGKIEALRLT